MKTAASLTLAAAALTLAACAQSKKTAAPKTAPSITAVRMDRGACFGRCPVYSLELNANGSARYDGKTFTEYQGIWEKNVGAGKAQSLLKEFEAARVDTCQRDYPMLVSDLPTVRYTVTYTNGTTQDINNANFGPSFLATLARQLDEAIPVNQTWRKVADTTAR